MVNDDVAPPITTRATDHEATTTHVEPSHIRSMCCPTAEIDPDANKISEDLTSKLPRRPLRKRPHVRPPMASQVPLHFRVHADCLHFAMRSRDVVKPKKIPSPVYEGGAPRPRPNPPRLLSYCQHHILKCLETERALQLRSVLARSTTLLALAGIPSPVSALAVTAVTTTTTATERPPLALALAEHATRGSVRPLLLDVRRGDDLGGEVQPLAEVVEALGGQGVVVVLPRELGLDIAAGGERLASLDDKEVLGVDVGVLGEVEVLLRDEHALTEEVLHQAGWLVSISIVSRESAAGV